jgi:hypothetical protein
MHADDRFDSPSVFCREGCSESQIRKALGLGTTTTQNPEPLDKSADTPTKNPTPKHKSRPRIRHAEDTKSNRFEWGDSTIDGRHMRPVVELYDDDRLTHRDRAVFLALSYFQSKRAPGTLVTWVSRSDIAEQVGRIIPLEEKLTDKQVITSEKHLCRYGWLDVIPWIDGNGFKKAATYVLFPLCGKDYEVAWLKNLRCGGGPILRNGINHNIPRENRNPLRVAA